MIVMGAKAMLLLLQADHRAVVKAGDDAAGVYGETVECELGIKRLFPDRFTVLKTYGSDEALTHGPYHTPYDLRRQGGWQSPSTKKQGSLQEN